MDVVCINQEDIPERSQQLSLMRRIYKKAENVIGWLGEEGTLPWDMDRAIHHLHFWSRECDLNEARMEELSSIGNPLEPWPWDEENWGAIERLFQRPFWTRLWIVQELVLARKPAFLVNYDISSELEFDTVSKALENWSRARET
ncbi:hypothetical protein K469DRAFT_699715 [Zopfia rhizophila CBS 207.26]|uniref:Heterokaryon incompatibility domain-containing protein n=1 Tax=Zopfia rhizophila CBS 207.26 TaxID=1314779 RepID=A0A6A6EDM9_9PEZI|nr:hypothetical protein K469DRAFT_699715 [Zopfia rhizophila CBS 207.26]